MIRRILYVAGVALLTVLWLAVTAMWVRAQWYWDGWQRVTVRYGTLDRRVSMVRVDSVPRSLMVSVYAMTDQTYADAPEMAAAQAQVPAQTRWTAESRLVAEPVRIIFPMHVRGEWWFRWLNVYPGGAGGTLFVPYWFLFALASAPIASLLLPRLRRWRRQRRARRGLCVRCGYDLQGNPAAERCPECGAPKGPVPVPSGGRD